MLSKIVIFAGLFVTSLNGFAGSARDYADSYKRADSIPYPSDNQYSEEKYDLGWKLFFDPRLSGSNFISCATCHNPALAWGDGMALGTGHGMKKLGRRTPTILNLAWGEPLMWDGRAESLEAQALGPIEAGVEMNMPLDKLIMKLSTIKGYKILFSKAFGDSEVTKERISKAIATYERTVVSGQAPFDKWVEGDEDAISNAAKRGFVLFNEKARCAECHSGWRFTDDSFHDIGIRTEDLGRGKIIPEVEVLKHAFKTPTLRNIDLRGPYMHNGSEKTLSEVMDVYNQGGRMKRPSLSEQIRPLGLTESEKRDVIQFMLTLTSKDKPVTIPILPK